MNTVLRRLGFYAIAAFAAVTMNFFLLRMLPGSALQTALSNMRGTISPAQLKALEEQYGVGSHQSLLSQYLTYLGHLLQGNLGTSTAKSVSVSSVLGNDLPWTIGLIGTATVV